MSSETTPHNWTIPDAMRLWFPIKTHVLFDHNMVDRRWNWIGKVKAKYNIPFDPEPMYHKSASTAKCLGGPVPPKKEIKMPEPKQGPKLEWEVVAGYWADKGHAFKIQLLVDGEMFRSGFVSRPDASGLSERQARKLERKIEEAKVGIMRTYLLVTRQSGPVTGA